MTLPLGWAEAKFADILDYQGGSQPPKSEFSSEPKPGYIRLLQIRDFGSDAKAVYIRDNGKWPRCFADDIMIGRYGASVGKILTGKSGAYNVALVKMIFDRSSIEPKYLFHWLHLEAFQGKLVSVSRSAQDGFNKEDLAEIPFWLPPLAEQRRIVAKLDALTARLARARAELDRVPVLAAQLVRSALADAFDSLADVQTVALKELSSKIGSGSTPRGGKNVYVDDGVPFIRSQNVYFEGFEYDGLVRITDGAAKALAGVTVHENDVLLNITGASIGRACIVPSELIGARVSQHVSIIRPAQKLLPAFLLAFLRTPTIQDWVWNANYGVTRQALTKGMIEAIGIPLPSIKTQQEVVRRLEATFARADRLEAEAARARALLDRLESTLLAKAFRGELVPQDPNDEPAQVLLNRIRTQRAAAPKAKRGRKAKVAA